MKKQFFIFSLAALLLIPAFSLGTAADWSTPSSDDEVELSTGLENYILTEVLEPVTDLGYDPAQHGVVDVIRLQTSKGQLSPYWSTLTWMPRNQYPYREFWLSIYTRKQEQWVELTRLTFGEPPYVGLNPEMRQVHLDPSWYWLELSGLQGANTRVYQLITFDEQDLNVELTIEHDGSGNRAAPRVQI